MPTTETTPAKLFRTEELDRIGFAADALLPLAKLTAKLEDGTASEFTEGGDPYWCSDTTKYILEALRGGARAVYETLFAVVEGGSDGVEHEERRIEAARPTAARLVALCALLEHPDPWWDVQEHLDAVCAAYGDFGDEFGRLFSLAGRWKE